MSIESLIVICGTIIVVVAIISVAYVIGKIAEADKEMYKKKTNSVIQK